MKHPVVFISMNRFGYACLAELLANGKTIDLIVTLKPEVTGAISDYQDLAPLARQYQIPIRLVTHIKDISSELIALQPQLLLVLGWSQLIDQKLIDSAARGCVGSHPALLPRNRGRAAIPWHFINEEKSGGLTFFFIQAGLDDGPIIAQTRFTLKPTDNASSYYQKLLQCGPRQLVSCFDQILAGTIVAKPQDESQASYLLIRRAKHSQLVFTQTVRSVINQVRAVTELYPLAFFGYRGHTYTTKAAAQPVLAPKFSGFPGQIARVFADRLWIVCGDGVIELGQLECDGQPVAKVKTFFKEGTCVNE